MTVTKSYEGGAVLIFERCPDGKRRLVADVGADDDSDSGEWAAHVVRLGVTVRGPDRGAVMRVVRAAIRGGAC